MAPELLSDDNHKVLGRMSKRQKQPFQKFGVLEAVGEHAPL
jgi:hypothetical protein